MPAINEFGTVKIRDEKPAVRRLTLEAVCDSSISYPQLEKVIRKLKTDFGKDSDCKISVHDDIHIVLSQSNNTVKKTLYEEYISAR